MIAIKKMRKDGKVAEDFCWSFHIADISSIIVNLFATVLLLLCSFVLAAAWRKS